MLNPRHPNNKSEVQYYVCEIDGADRYISVVPMIGNNTLGFEMGPDSEIEREAKRISYLELERMWGMSDRRGTASQRCRELVLEGYFLERVF